jgi:calcium/calmodulin-dependent protein kinase (CaM kinase) II
MVRSHLRWLNDDAVVLSYVRLTQKVINGSAITTRCCETRLWQLDSDGWRQMHVHRS